MILDKILLQFAKAYQEISHWFPDLEFCRFSKCKLNIWKEQMTADISSPKQADQLPTYWSHKSMISQSPFQPGLSCDPTLPYTCTRPCQFHQGLSGVIPLLPSSSLLSHQCLTSPIPAPTSGVLRWNCHELNVWWTKKCIFHTFWMGNVRNTKTLPLSIPYTTLLIAHWVPKSSEPETQAPNLYPQSPQV